MPDNQKLATHFKVKNFARLQHYKNRTPLWIKLYNDLLEDEAIDGLCEAARYHFIAITLLASRYQNKLKNCPDFIGRKISAQSPVDLEALGNVGLIEPIPASAVLAKCLPRGEESRGEKKEESYNNHPDSNAASAPSDSEVGGDFEEGFSEEEQITEPIAEPVSAPEQQPVDPPAAKPQPNLTAAEIIAAFDQVVGNVFGQEARRPWPHGTDRVTADRWIELGVSEQLCRDIFAADMKRKRENGAPPPATLSYYNNPIRDAIASGVQPSMSPDEEEKHRLACEQISLASDEYWHRQGVTLAGGVPGNLFGIDDPSAVGDHYRDMYRIKQGHEPPPAKYPPPAGAKPRKAGNGALNP